MPTNRLARHSGRRFNGDRPVASDIRAPGTVANS